MLPPLTWTAPGLLALLAIVVLATALGLRARLRRPGEAPAPAVDGPDGRAGQGQRARRPDRRRALRRLRCWCCCPGLEIASRRDRAVLCLVALLASVGLSVAGLLLERACRVPPSGTDEEIPAARA